QYTMDLSDFWDVPGVRPQSFLYESRLVTTLPGRNVAVLDLKNRQAETFPLPGAIQKFSVSDDGVLRCKCMPSLIVDPYESHDFGETWVKSSHDRFMLPPIFKDKEHGVAFQNGMYSSAKIVYTEDGGETWKSSIDTRYHFHHIFYSKDKKSA